ncbi:ribonuclease H-like domain-containing protein [Tanacetum coccineum]
MSFDDLYNNFKIIKQKVKGTANSSSISSSQNMAFVSSPSSTNEVNTAYGVSTDNIQVSTASTQVSTASTQVSTANLSDATVYAFLANQPNGSQLVHEDLEQIHEDDLEEMDLKWQLALLSMRTRKFFQKTGRKITINGSDTVGYDKSKVECFNCHKLGHFVRECRGPRNQDNKSRNQDSSRRTINVEEISSKAMLAIDGADSEWLFGPPNLAFAHSGLEGSKAWEFEAMDDLRIANYNYHQRERVVSGNNYTRVNYNYFAQKAHPSAQRNMVPRAVLMKTGLRTLNNARLEHEGNCPYLSDFKEFDGGYVTFGGGAKGGKITGKGTLKTDKLNFEDVYFIKKLQFNLFNVSRICDKKNSVLFTDTRCFVLSPNFKLDDKSQVLLKVPRKNNMYSIDMKNIVPKESLTCLVAKATLDESML